MINSQESLSAYQGTRVVVLAESSHKSTVETSAEQDSYLVTHGGVRADRVDFEAITQSLGVETVQRLQVANADLIEGSSDSNTSNGVSSSDGEVMMSEAAADDD